MHSWTLLIILDVTTLLFLLLFCADILWKETCDVKAPLFLKVYYYLTLLLLLYCCAEILSMQPRDAEVLLFKNGKLRGRLHSGIKVPWLNPICNMMHWHAWRDSFQCVPWLIYTCHGCCTLASRCLHALISVTWLIHALISVTWLIHQYDVTCSHVWHTSHICAHLTHMCAITVAPHTYMCHNGCTLPPRCHDAHSHASVRRLSPAWHDSLSPH